MTIFSKPDMTRQWASGANPADIKDPDVVDPGKYATGWSAEIPPFEYFNYLQQQFSQALAWLNQNGLGEWDALTDYPDEAYTKGSDGAIYKSNTATIGNDPTSHADWDIQNFYNPPTVAFKQTWITASDPTWTPDARTVSVRITATSGGGGAGGVDTTVSGETAVSGGGGAGGTEIWSGDVDPTYAIVIGAGGTGGTNGTSNTDGTGGGQTTVISANVSLDCRGGGGGDRSGAARIKGVSSDRVTDRAWGGNVVGNGQQQFNGGDSGVGMSPDGRLGSEASGGISYYGAYTSLGGGGDEAWGCGRRGYAHDNYGTPAGTKDGVDGVVLIEEWMV